MSERKYRQRGYQDEPRAPRPEQRPAEKKEYAPRGQPPTTPKTFNMPGFREAVRCARCGNELSTATAWADDARCARCGADLHACAQCVNFDTGAPFECVKPIPLRVSARKTRATAARCFEPRTTVERETKIDAAGERPAGVRRSLQVRPSRREAVDVFVTGGTGYLGRPLIEALLARGHTVRALTRERFRPRCLLVPSP